MRSLPRSPARSSSNTILANEQMADPIAGMHAMQRPGEPGDIAALAAFLVSSEASWITGQVFPL